MIRNNEYVVELIKFVEENNGICSLSDEFPSIDVRTGEFVDYSKYLRISISAERFPIFILINIEEDEDEDNRFLFTLNFSIRTTSWMFDGERSDLHDMMSVIFSLFVRSLTEYAIVNIGVLGFGSESELYSKDILILNSKFIKSEVNKSMITIVDESMFIVKLVSDILFHVHPLFESSNLTTAGNDELNSWINDLLLFLDEESNYEINNWNSRTSPDWSWFSSKRSGLSILKYEEDKGKMIKSLIDISELKELDGIESKLIQFNNVYNTISREKILFCEHIMRISGESSKDYLIVSLENLFYFIGNYTIIQIEDNCGREFYELEKSKLLNRQSIEMNFLYSNVEFVWEEKINDQRFEKLCYELLKREENIFDVKLVGPTNQGDGGRDLLIKMLEIPKGLEVEVQNMYKFNKIIVQCKGYSKTVGKSSVFDIRDTIEHYDADGYFLIVSSRISVPLLDRLSKLREKYLVYWWGREEIEERLRSWPDILVRFNDIVRVSN